MIGRARFCNGLNRQMPRCMAVNKLGEPCRAAHMRGHSTCFRHSGGAVQTDVVDGGRSFRRRGLNPARAAFCVYANKQGTP